MANNGVTEDTSRCCVDNVIVCVFKEILLSLW